MAQSSDHGEKQDRTSSWYRGINFWLWLLGILAAIAMLIPAGVANDYLAPVVLLRLLLALVILAAPFLFLLLLGSRIVSWLLGGGRFTFVAGVALTLTLLAMPPYLGNYWLDGQAKALFAKDHDDDTKSSAKVIAIRDDGANPFFKNNGGKCDGLCQRLLMSGKRVLVLKQDINLAIDPAIEVDSFRLERRASCPDVALPHVPDPTVNYDSRADDKVTSAEPLMRLEFAKGNCLISEKAPLRIADIVLSTGVAHDSGRAIRGSPADPNERFTARGWMMAAFNGLSPFADTVWADRITVHERHDDTFQETFRQTFVSAQNLFPLYIPIAGDVVPTLVRYEKIINSPPGYEEEFGRSSLWRNFLWRRLGDDLELHSDNVRKDMRMVLNKAMQHRTVNALEIQVASGFVNIDYGALESEDRKLVLRLLADERFPISPSYVVVKRASGANADYFDAVATSLFKRLRVLVAGTEITAQQPSDKAEDIAEVISALPRQTILRHRADLEWLARQDPKWDPSNLAKRQLSELDAMAAPAQQAK